MDPGRRRRSSFATARLILLWAVNAGLAALVLLLALGRSPAAEPATQGVARAAIALARGPDLRGLDGRRARNARLGAIARRWIEEAVGRSKGAVAGEDVHVALHVRDLDTGVELAGIEAERSLRTASNMKLVTTAAALVLFGPAWGFETVFEAGGEVRGGLLAGDLVVRAAADPLHDAGGEGRMEGRLVEVAREIARAGVRRIRGDVVLDEGDFAEPGPAPGWPDEGQRWADYCALAGGFSANAGVLHATVRPSGVDRPASVSVHPVPHGLRSRYDVVGTAGSKLDVRVGATTSAVTIRGVLPASRAEWSADFSHPDPVQLFASVLRGALEAAGVGLEGEIVRRRDAPGGRVLATLRTPLTETLVPINTHSLNGVADQVLLAMGHAFGGAGSRQGGERAVRLALERLGVDGAGLVQVDGSGLSRLNRASPRQITALIAAVLGRGEPTRDAFLGSLAAAGRTGTLVERMAGTVAEGNVFAKTGWIAGTSALSGVGRTPDGRWIVFSILVEYPRSAGGLNTHCFKPMQDEMVISLVEETP